MAEAFRLHFGEEEFMAFHIGQDHSTSIVSNLKAGQDEDYMKEYNAAIDGLEAGILAMWSAGMFATTSLDRLTKIIQTALDALANHLT